VRYGGVPRARRHRHRDAHRRLVRDLRLLLRRVQPGVVEDRVGHHRQRRCCGRDSQQSPALRRGARGGGAVGVGVRHSRGADAGLAGDARRARGVGRGAGARRRHRRGVRRLSLQQRGESPPCASVTVSLAVSPSPSLSPCLPHRAESFTVSPLYHQVSAACTPYRELRSWKATVRANTWTHLGAIYDGSNWTIHVDGIWVDSAVYAAPARFPPPTMQPLVFGRDPPSATALPAAAREFSGLLYEFARWGFPVEMSTGCPAAEQLSREGRDLLVFLPMSEGHGTVAANTAALLSEVEPWQVLSPPTCVRRSITHHASSPNARRRVKDEETASRC
jgi:hypothetical protein